MAVIRKFIFSYVRMEFRHRKRFPILHGMNKWTEEKCEKEKGRIGERPLLDMVHLLRHCYLYLFALVVSFTLLLTHQFISIKVFHEMNVSNRSSAQFIEHKIIEAFFPLWYWYQVAIQNHQLDGFDRVTQLNECVMNCVLNYSQSSFKTLSGQSFISLFHFFFF